MGRTPAWPLRLELLQVLAAGPLSKGGASRLVVLDQEVSYDRLFREPRIEAKS
jgi:hypothetical protein